jgi:hypothetical protein
MNLRQLFKGALLLLAVNLLSNTLTAQCGTFQQSTKEEDGMAAHSLYRDAMKANNMEEAFPNWKIAYDIAPAANGSNHLHFSDGRKIHQHYFEKATDAAKKKEHADMVLKLYDGQLKCYGDAYKAGQDSYLLGRKGYDMFYYFTDYLGDNPYQSVIDVLKMAVDKGGDNIEDIILVPYAGSVVNLYAKEKISKEAARAVYTRLNEIADRNIANNAATSARFVAAKEAMNYEFAKIEYHIFDCEYFVAKLKPEYATKGNDPVFLEEAIKTLKRQGCEDPNPFLAELETKWAVYAAEINAQRQAEFEANNPGVLANKLYKEGDFKGAIDKYEEAMATETDIEKKASYKFSIASIQGRKLKQYSQARSTAQAAANMRSGWGDPYMLIADLYASSASSCGDDWNQRLAVLAAIEMYQRAKAVDPSVADDANDKISRYLSSRPAQEEGFMRGVKEGQSATVGCWIGETVTIKFK